ncbi:MAG: porin family protein [Thiotrichales bacterium]|nr:porin family protein [Thiotrichales bacterium]
MKRILISAAIAATSLAFANTALANDNGMYVGASYDMMTIDDSADKFDTNVLTLKLGKNFTQNLGIELVYGVGVSDSSVTGIFDGEPVTATAGVKNYYGAYLTGVNPVTDQISLTGKIGWTNTTLDVKGTYLGETVKTEFDDDSFSWSVGALYKATEAVSLTADYTLLYMDGDSDIKGFTLGAKYAF